MYIKTKGRDYPTLMPTYIYIKIGLCDNILLKNHKIFLHTIRIKETSIGVLFLIHEFSI